jgi:hypothetical protein
MLNHIEEIFPAISTSLAMFALIFTIRSGILNKRADIMMECHRRSDALLALRYELTKRLGVAEPHSADASLEADIKAWIQRFWCLQFDEYEFWRRGFIDDGFFKYWMLSRRRGFEKSTADQLSPSPTSFDEMTYEVGFEDVSWMWIGATSPRSGDFKGFMQLVRENQIDRAMRMHGPGLLCRWGFWG